MTDIMRTGRKEADMKDQSREATAETPTQENIGRACEVQPKRSTATHPAIKKEARIERKVKTENINGQQEKEGRRESGTNHKHVWKYGEGRQRPHRQTGPRMLK